jgi:integrase
MASIQKIGDSWKAQVTVNGQRKSKRFNTKAEANLWAARTEVELADRRAGRIPEDKTFTDLLDRYEREVSVNKRGHRWEAVRLRLLSKMAIGSVKLAEINETDVVRWRDERLKQVSESSVNREWALLSAACTVAVKEFRWLNVNPFLLPKKPKPSAPRTRRVNADDIEKILFALGYSDECELDTQTKRVGAAFLFAIETAMRAGEIVNMTWDHVKERYVHLPMTKNGHSRDVPLSSKARAILARLPREGDSCFGITSQNLDALFRRAKARVGIDDLHFHDSRAEALTRLSKVFQPMELAKVSGHRDLRILLNTYYRVTVDELADKLD